MSYNPKEVGQRIKDIRLKLGMNMTTFGKAIDDYNPNGKTKSGTVSNWETGKNLPNNERLKKIAELGNVSVLYLLEGKDAVSFLEGKDAVDFLAEMNIMINDHMVETNENLKNQILNVKDLSYTNTELLLLKRTKDLIDKCKEFEEKDILLDLNTILTKIIEMIDELDNDQESNEDKKKNIELIYEDLSDFIKEQDTVHTFYKQIKKHLN